MKRLLLVLLVAVSASAEEWTPVEIGLEASYQLLLLADWKQTSEFHKMTTYDWNGPGGNLQYHRVEEANPFLPRDPKQRTINAACAVSAVGHFLISNALTHRYRMTWQSTTVLIEASFVRRNARIGVRCSF